MFKNNQRIGIKSDKSMGENYPRFLEENHQNASIIQQIVRDDRKVDDPCVVARRSTLRSSHHQQQHLLAANYRAVRLSVGFFLRFINRLLGIQQLPTPHPVRCRGGSWPVLFFSSTSNFPPRIYVCSRFYYHILSLNLESEERPPVRRLLIECADSCNFLRL